MNLLTNYQSALQAIYDHVDFKEDWVIYPIDDCTKRFWDTDGDTVYYANSQEEFKSQEGDYYEASVEKQRFYKKWIYEGEQLTMIFLNPHIDGMRYFSVFDNAKRLSR